MDMNTQFDHSEDQPHGVTFHYARVEQPGPNDSVYATLVLKAKTVPCLVIDHPDTFPPDIEAALKAELKIYKPHADETGRWFEVGRDDAEMQSIIDTMIGWLADRNVSAHADRRITSHLTRGEW